MRGRKRETEKEEGKRRRGSEYDNQLAVVDIQIAVESKTGINCHPVNKTS
jgi:hypothetical protein